MAMRPSLLSILLVALFPCSPIFAADEARKPDSESPLLKPAVSAGFSYPLVFSVSLGAALPLGNDRDYPIPTVPALRIDGEVGLGGGTAAVGVYVPVHDLFALNLKAVRMRTWLWTWNEETNRTFNGGVVEFVIPSAHGGPKVGVGSFRDTEPLNNSRRSFTYVFLGVGW
jgi:hypothetical protein